MHFLKLVFKNAFRHRLRTALTALGLAIAVLAFGLLQTVVGAWFSDAAAASDARLVTRNAISLVFPLPVAYEARIKAVDGVTSVARSNWFGGIYKEPKNFFAQFAVSENYLDLYPEFILPEVERSAWSRDRKGVLVGRQLADQFGLKVDEAITIQGTIYPGQWEFVIRGIFDGSDSTKATRTLLFHWEYLNEYVRKVAPRRADQVGVYIIGIRRPEEAATMSLAIDAIFKNSLAETLSETEQAFRLGFVAMSSQIVTAVRIVSYVVIVIILAVMANTMAMSARERTAEYATLKALGFAPRFVAALILGESVAICTIGGGIGLALTPVATGAFSTYLSGIFPVFRLSPDTIMLQAACAAVVAVVAAIVPAIQASRVNIVEGLRAMG